MKKVLVGLLVIVVAGLALLPFLGGVKAESSLEVLRENIDANPSYNAQWVNYDKGWNKSKAQLAITLSFLGAFGELDSEDAKLLVDFDINHGPALMDGSGLGWYSGTVQLSNDADSWLKDKLELENQGPLWVAEFITDLSGSTTINDHTQDITILMDEGGSIKIAAYEGQGQLKPNGHLSYSGLLPEIKFLKDDGEVLAKDISIYGESTMDASLYHPLLYPGQAEFKLASLVLKGDEGGAALQGLKFAAKQDYSEDLKQMNMAFSAQLENAELESEEGEATKESLSDASFKFAMNKINTSFLEKYMDAYSQVDYTDPSAMQMMGMQMMGLMMSDLIPGGPELSIEELKFKTNEGPVDVKASLSIQEGANAAGNPMALIGLVDFSADLLVAKPLALKLAESSARSQVETELMYTEEELSEEDIEQMVKDQTAMQLDMLAIQGFVKEENGNYTSKMSFKNGEALVNGQAIPLPF